MHTVGSSIPLLQLCLLGALAAPPDVAAKSDLRTPPDLLGSGRGHADSISMIDGRNVHNVGNIWMNVTNFGLIGSQPGTYQPWSDAPSAQWPGGSTTEYLWSAGLWIGAVKNGQKHVTTAQYEMEFRPARNPVARMYEAHEGDLGGLHTPALGADDDGDGRIDEDPLDGRDNDGDGRIDEDYAAIGNQMFTCEYRDDDPIIQLIYPEHEPLGVKVRQTSMQWDDPFLRDFVAFNFQITCDQYPPLEEVYVGLFADPDIGPRGGPGVAFDDMAGFWEGVVEAQTGHARQNVKVSIGYMWDQDGDFGESDGYVGIAFLGLERTGFGTNAMNRRVHSLPLHNFRSFAGRTYFDLGGDPTNDEQRYKVLDGTAPHSLDAAHDPIASHSPNDYRMVVSVGSFGALGAGDTLGITAAIVIARGFEGLQQAAAHAQIAFDGVWADVDHSAATGVDGKETKHCGPEETGRIYPIRGPDSFDKFAVPCDSNCAKLANWRQRLQCAMPVPQTGCIWIDGDCDRSTGVNGAESIVHWLTHVPPPAPHMRLTAREDQVDVYFDDLSEKALDQILNVSDFESYRIWRSAEWQRPPGSGLDTGPTHQSWVLMAEYDIGGNTIGPDTGFNDIVYTPRIPPAAIQFYHEWSLAHPNIDPPLLPGITESQRDTALVMAKGMHYYHWVDPPFIRPPSAADPPCQTDGTCEPIRIGPDLFDTRCDPRTGRCRPTTAPPRTGSHYFYSVTATDHLLAPRGGILVATGRGVGGDPQTNFLPIEPPSNALRPADYSKADDEIYVVPNPATRASLEPWQLHPNNTDATGVKIEFRHMPAAAGKITIFTLAGDRVQELPFDGRAGDGTVPWDLVSRNGQDVASGVYLYTVEANDPGFKRFIGKFVVIR